MTAWGGGGGRQGGGSVWSGLQAGCSALDIANITFPQNIAKTSKKCSKVFGKHRVIRQSSKGLSCSVGSLQKSTFEYYLRPSSEGFE